jgi:hypothetical protein
MSRGTPVAERSPIFGAKLTRRALATEASEAFDSLGNKRYDLNPSTGTIFEIDRGRTIWIRFFTRLFFWIVCVLPINYSRKLLLRIRPTPTIQPRMIILG